MHEHEIIDVIKSCKIFNTLSNEDCQEIIENGQQLELLQGDSLFSMGEPSDGLYILIKGKLLAHLTSEGLLKAIGVINPGETVGELGALSGKPRSLSISAVQDSKLIKLSEEYFKILCKKHPTILSEMLESLISRSQKTITLLSEKKQRRHIAVVPCHNTVDFSNFHQHLIENISYQMKITTFDPEQLQDEDKISEQINYAIEHDHRIIYFFDWQHIHMLEQHLHRIDSIYVIADDYSDYQFDGTLQNILKSQTEQGCELKLVVLHDDGIQIAQNTKLWLEKAPFALHYHIHRNYKSDYQRLLRYITGEALGLIIGGGGARGWGALGALKAITENQIHIDAVGGTSVGAVIAACYATSFYFEETEKKFQRIAECVYHPFALKNFTWPLISLLSGANGTEGLQMVFQDIQIEDLFIPYFCISSDLNTEQESIHQTGTLWEKLRASVSIPGIVPPFVIDGHIHVDGGLLNNLPVNVMRKFFDQQGKIIAISLNDSNHFDSTQYHFPPVMKFIHSLMYRLGLSTKKYKMPNFIDTCFKSLLLGATQKEQYNGLSADLLITMNFKEYNMLGVEMKEAKEIFEMGYEISANKIKYWER